MKTDIVFFCIKATCDLLTQHLYDW